MKQFLSSRSKMLCLNVTGFFAALAALIAFFDSEPVIAFLAVMILSMVVLVPLYLVMFVQVSRAKKLMVQQEEETGDVLSELNDSEMKQINDHIAIYEDWIVDNALNRQCVIHKHSIVSIHECERGLEINTTLKEQPFVFVLSATESGNFEKECILRWYDTLYEIPLEVPELEIHTTNQKKMTVVLIGVAVAVLAAAGVIFSQMGTVTPEPNWEEDKYIYFYDYLAETSMGSVDDISYDVVKSQDEYLLYIYNEGKLYVELELDLYDANDTLVDTAWSGIVRPGHYTSVYIDEEPASVWMTSSWFYTFGYHVPEIEYDVEYAWREYNTWINVVLNTEDITLENVRDVGVHEYAIEELAYTGADCVYVYDAASAVRVTDKVTGAEMLDTSMALYRIDFELYDYRIQIVGLNGTDESHVETVEIMEE